MKKENFNIPNCITSLRIVGTVILLFIKPLTIPFFTVYTFTGITDALDGFVARKTNTVSEFGTKLDSVADLMFYAVMLIKIFPVLWSKLPKQIWIIVALILAIRLSAYIVSAIKYKQFASNHSYLNKLTGLFLFCVPYFLSIPLGIPLCWAVCLIAIMASSYDLCAYILKKQIK